MRARLTFRHLGAVIVHPDDADRQQLLRQLQRLGLQAKVLATTDELTGHEACDLVFFDGDCGFSDRREGPVHWPSAARIALIGSEAPGRLEWVLDQQPVAYLSKPIRTGGVFTALAFGLRQQQRLAGLEAIIERLDTKVRLRRVVLAALIRLMNEQGKSEAEAFSALRRVAMQRRVTIEEASALLLAAATPPHDERARSRNS